MGTVGWIAVGATAWLLGGSVLAVALGRTVRLRDERSPAAPEAVGAVAGPQEPAGRPDQRARPRRTAPPRPARGRLAGSAPDAGRAPAG